MKSVTMFLSALIWVGCAITRNEINTETKPQVLIDAEKMAAAFLKRDYKIYAEYIYAGLFEKAGGKEVFMQRIEESIKTSESQGARHDSVIISEPSKAVMCNGQWQCLLKQEIVISNAGQEPFSDVAYLIGISTDNGKSWAFLNGGRRPINILKKEFPNIFDSLTLEEKYLAK